MNKKLLLSTLLLIIFIDSLGYFIVIPVFFHLINQPSLIFSDTPTSWQLLMLDIAVPISSLTSIIANPMIGAWSDRWGRRSVLLGCLLISFLGFFLPFLGVIISSFFLILLGRVLTGMASTSQPIAQAAISDLCVGEERAFYFSLISCAMASAMVIGPLVGTLLSNINLQAPYLFASGLVVVSLVLASCLLKETAPLKKDKTQNSFSFLTALKAPVIRKPLLLILLTQFSWSLYFLSAPLQMVKTYGDTMDHANFFLAWLGFWMVFGFLVLYRYVLRIVSLKKIIAGSLLVAMSGLVVCFLWHSEMALWVIMIPVAISVGFTYPSLLALLSHKVSERERGRVMGAASALLALAWMLSGFLFMLVPVPLLVSTVLYAVGFFLLRTYG